ncbi:MAG: non-homologous end-joining DNA ligase [Dehalogenimonas sp.]
MPQKIKTSLDGHEIELTNLEKVFFPDGTTKSDLIRYYLKIAPVMLPHLEGRPLSFQRFPDGVEAEGFFQKQAPSSYPSWITRISQGQREIVDYASADSAADLVYFAQQAVIVLHTALARGDKADYPDLMIFDLDPQTDSFEPVRQTALGLKELLHSLGLVSYLKVTGGRGLHVAVPLDRSGNFEIVHDFALGVAKFYQSRHPEDTTTEMSKAKRGSRVFIDVNRNHFSQTAVAPYSVRARKTPSVAAPITWEELEKPDLKPDGYTIGNVFELLKRRPDPWKGIYKKGQSVKEATEKLKKLES